LLYDALIAIGLLLTVQMSLHQPGDVVRMMDKGIAVQPGLRTLFELHYSQVIIYVLIFNAAWTVF